MMQVPPTLTTCSCGGKKSCAGNQSSSRCDPEEGMCMCGNMNACYEPTPWCVEEKCKCSNEESYYVKGDGSIKGTCQGEKEKCMADGTCVGMELYVSIHK